MRPVMGNHDAWFAFGLPHPRPAWMGEGELAHQRWVHAQLDPALRPIVAAVALGDRGEIGAYRSPSCTTPSTRRARLRGPGPRPRPGRPGPPVRAVSCRAGLLRAPTLPAPGPLEIVGHARYVNPGALGCSPEPLARYALLDINREGACQLAFRAVPYDPGPLFAAFEEREVPERAFIMATFFGG